MRSIARMWLPAACLRLRIYNKLPRRQVNETRYCFQMYNLHMRR